VSGPFVSVDDVICSANNKFVHFQNENRKLEEHNGFVTISNSAYKLDYAGGKESSQTVTYDPKKKQRKADSDKTDEETEEESLNVIAKPKPALREPGEIDSGKECSNCGHSYKHQSGACWWKANHSGANKGESSWRNL
jgi:hypothetical protein